MFRALATTALVALAVLTGSQMASAADYTPQPPTTPTLAGSTAMAQCVGDVPWITYDVTLTDPDNLSKSHNVDLILTDGTHKIDLALGTLVNNKLSGRVLWPGASTDAQGNPTGWPGWVKVNGQWQQTSDVSSAVDRTVRRPDVCVRSGDGRAGVHRL
jgi:hypothetical protein